MFSRNSPYIGRKKKTKTDKRQKTEDRRQKKDKRQKTADRRQKTEEKRKTKDKRITKDKRKTNGTYCAYSTTARGFFFSPNTEETPVLDRQGVLPLTDEARPHQCSTRVHSYTLINKAGFHPCPRSTKHPHQPLDLGLPPAAFGHPHQFPEKSMFPIAFGRPLQRTCPPLPPVSKAQGARHSCL